jgi:hypothetical protein
MEIVLNLLRRLWQSDQWALRTSRLPPKNRIVPAWPISSACYRTKSKATHRASNRDFAPQRDPREATYSAARSLNELNANHLAAPPDYFAESALRAVLHERQLKVLQHL